MHLSKLFKRVKEESDSRNKIRQLIFLGAPLNLLKELTGMNGVDFAAVRKKLGVNNTGRAQIPDEEELETIYQAWRKREFETDLTIDDWIDIGKETKIALSTIYPVIKGSSRNASVTHCKTIPASTSSNHVSVA